jgi:3-hydroxybutyryl-CoA dehydratase
MNNELKNRHEFEVVITNNDRLAFAELSGDWNPLHTDDKYATSTEYQSCILHGAYSAGLISKMAGMIYPGEKCLLHGMQLKFIKPIKTPMTVRVIGEILRDDGNFGEVKCKIENKSNGMLMAEGSYQYGRHSAAPKKILPITTEDIDKSLNSRNKLLITGASGALGSALMDIFQGQSLPLRHKAISRFDEDQIYEDLGLNHQRFSTIVHCGWPEPNNVKITDVTCAKSTIDDQLTEPLLQIIKLAKLLKKYGDDNSSLVLVGSSWSMPGSHSWKSPFYSLSKGMIPNLVKILAFELAPLGKRVVGVNLDILDGGMSRTMTGALKQMAADRTLTGRLPVMSEVAGQLAWIINNQSKLISGAFIDLTGGAQP